MKQSEIDIEKIDLQGMLEIYGDYYTKRYTDNCESSNIRYDQLQTALSAKMYRVQQPDYNQEAFDRVIKAIELNGLTNFNMTTFWGKISSAVFKRNENNELDSPIHKLSMHYSECSTTKNILDSFTNSFNCDSVGCIAGFAMAEAVNWKQPKWLREDSRDYLEAFEGIACAFLNIPIQTGAKLFYGDGGCIWSFLTYHEPENYGSLEWETSEDIDYLNCEYPDQWTDEAIALSSISFKEASDALRRLASGEILIDSTNDFRPRYSKEQKQKFLNKQSRGRGKNNG